MPIQPRKTPVEWAGLICLVSQVSLPAPMLNVQYCQAKELAFTPVCTSRDEVSGVILSCAGPTGWEPRRLQLLAFCGRLGSASNHLSTKQGT